MGGRVPGWKGVGEGACISPYTTTDAASEEDAAAGGGMHAGSSKRKKDMQRKRMRIATMTDTSKFYASLRALMEKVNGTSGMLLGRRQ